MPVATTEPLVSSVKVVGDVLAVRVSPVARLNAPALSHVPPEYDAEALTFTVPSFVTPPVIVRPLLPAPASVEIVPSLTRVDPMASVDALPQPLLVRERCPVELMRSVSPAAVFFVVSVTLSEQVPCTFSASWSPFVPDPSTSASTDSAPDDG